ncbi:hypothetical protein Sste5344_002308 [Sporothrix stenoceras]
MSDRFRLDNQCHEGIISKEWFNWTTAFLVLFVWRYLRQVVHLVSFWMYRPAQPLTNPKITRNDVTVIVPTVDPHNPHFIAGLTTAISNTPAKIIICSGVQIDVLAANEANKRAQVMHGVKYADTEICVLMDDHVLWKDTFLDYALPAFERDPKVGIVGTNKRVIREKVHDNLLHRVLNMVQCLYLERHNFEIRSSNAIDGGVFVVSGRTSLMRTSILQDPAFNHDYLNDYFLFGLVGPLAVDDDNFVTRWCIANGWRVKIQYCDETLITTSLGSAHKFTGGLKRWVRTTWRSNSTSLSSLHVYLTQPWSVYAVYLSLFTNFALFYDPLLLYAFAKSGLSSYHYVDNSQALDPIGYKMDGSLDYGTFVGADNFATTASANLFISFLPLICWIFAFKMVKPFAYFWRNPQDLWILWAYILFTYFHSLIKVNGLLTFYNAKWEGRDLASLNADLTPVGSTSLALEDFHIDTTSPGTSTSNPNVNPFAYASPYAASLALDKLHVNDDQEHSNGTAQGP